jgi:hypothetical protein
MLCQFYWEQKHWDQQQSSSQYNKELLQGHIDMHNQMRMALNYGFNGIWLWAWASSDNAQNLYRTRAHWTYDPAHSPQSYFSDANQLERWGEAVGNEVWREQEYFTEAIPTASSIVGAVPDTSPNDPDDPACRPNCPPNPGYWIQFDLAQRGRVHFIIRKTDSTYVRTLDLGYKNNTQKPTSMFNYQELYPLAAGRYRNLITKNTNLVRRPSVGSVSGDMNGTAAWWDLKDDNNVGAPNGNYTVQMYREGTPVGASWPLTIPL